MVQVYSWPAPLPNDTRIKVYYRDLEVIDMGEGDTKKKKFGITGVVGWCDGAG